MVLELGDSEVLGRGKVPSDSDLIALLRLAVFEGFVNFLAWKASQVQPLSRGKTLASRPITLIQTGKYFGKG